MISLVAAAVITLSLPAHCPLLLTKPVHGVQTIKCRGPGKGASYPLTAKTLLINVPLPPGCQLVLLGVPGKRILTCQ